MTGGLTLVVYLGLFVLPALLWCVVVAVLLAKPAASFVARLNVLERQVATSLIGLVSFLMLLRVVMGACALLELGNLQLVGASYPVRIASPNHGVIAGLPWFLLWVALASQWSRLMAWLQTTRYRLTALWLISAGALLVFAGIQGGIVNGVSGVYTHQGLLADTQHASWTSDFLQQHMQRISGELVPAYAAAHALTHPPLTLLLFTLVDGIGAFGMGLLTLALFSLVFPLAAKVAEARGAADGGLLTASLLLTTPAMLIYGAGSDDALYYVTWAGALALGYFAIAGNKYWLAVICGAVIALACNLTYASFVLLPAVMAFAGSNSMGGLVRYVREHVGVLSVIAAAFVLSLALEHAFTGFDPFTALTVAMTRLQGYRFTEVFATDPVQAISDRILTIFDFVIFSAPITLATWFSVWRNRSNNPMHWSMAATAFAVLAMAVACFTPGAGESGRGWGGLYLCWWFGYGAHVARQWASHSPQRLVAVSLCAIGFCQLMIDFGW